MSSNSADACLVAPIGAALMDGTVSSSNISATADGAPKIISVVTVKTEPSQSAQKLCVLGNATFAGLHDQLATANAAAPRRLRPNPVLMEAASHMGVIPICCKDICAVLHKDRFGSGGKGRCIEYANKWFTPNEFEITCGRASSKDWKRSIRYAGRGLGALIHQGVLEPHATSCTCTVCTDDIEALGPVRLFTPYKRKRRRSDDCKREPASVDERQGSTNCVQKPIQIARTIKHAELLRARATYQRMVAAHAELARIVGDMAAALDEGRALLEEQLPLALGDARLADPPAQRDLDPEHHKKCANCNRPSSAECSLCRRTPYCSTFCQRRDWASHQLECLRGPAEADAGDDAEAGTAEAGEQTAWILVDEVDVKHMADVDERRQQ